jgi:putative salt-induced outer membrane protein
MAVPIRTGQIGAVSVLAALGLLAGAAQAERLPEPVAAMIEAAAGDPETLKAVVRVAKKTNPDSIAEIDAQVAQLKAKAAAERKVELAEQGFFDGWQGKGEIGGSVSTGNTEEQRLALGLELEKNGLLWWHTVDATADVTREDSEVTKERFFLSLASHRRLSRRVYGVGVLWGEGDRFAGYYSRFSESVGLGYWLVERPDLKFRVEAGPALRQANYVETGPEHSASLRAAEYFTWAFAPRNQFRQSLVAYWEGGNSTVIGSTALTATLYEALAARASFEVRYESQPPRDRENTDTTSRLTLVYSF